MLAEQARVLNKPIAIAKADIQKAFDTIDFDAINKGLIEQGVAPKTRIAIMTELMNEFMRISFAGTSTRPIKRNC